MDSELVAQRNALIDALRNCITNPGSRVYETHASATRRLDVINAEAQEMLDAVGGYAIFRPKPAPEIVDELPDALQALLKPHIPRAWRYWIDWQRLAFWFRSVHGMNATPPMQVDWWLEFMKHWNAGRVFGTVDEVNGCVTNREDWPPVIGCVPAQVREEL